MPAGVLVSVKVRREPGALELLEASAEPDCPAEPKRSHDESSGEFLGSIVSHNRCQAGVAAAIFQTAYKAQGVQCDIEAP